MAFDEMLTRDLVIRAIEREGHRYRIDDDGDIRLDFSRRRGKDLTYFIDNEAFGQQVLSLKCLCPVLYERPQRADVVEFCNNWNVHYRIPRAIVENIETKSDCWIVLDYFIFCRDGITLSLVHEALVRFINGCYEFWSEADKRLD